jgi:hypothetical protein
MVETRVQEPHSWRPIVILVLACLLCLAPWVNKAFVGDEPLSVWIGQQVESDPIDFFGFEVNWAFTARPAVEYANGPPLVSYYLALFGSLFGWSEAVLRLALLFPALAVILGTYCLARRWCTRPVLAALATLVMPVFLICGMSAGGETLMLAFWVWAVVCWDRGIQGGSLWFLIVGAGLATLAALTAYVGILLVPLLLAYSLAIPTKTSWWLVFLLLPVAILATYETMSFGAYGRSLLVDLAEQTLEQPGAKFKGIWSTLLVSLAFTGGCAAGVLFFAPLVFPRRVVLYGAAAATVLILILPLLGDIGPHTLYAGEVRWMIAIQGIVLSLGGIALFWLAGTEFATRRDPPALLLLLWISMTFLFGAWTTWFIFGRSFVALAPAAGLLLMRRIDARWGADRAQDRWRFWWPLLPTAVAALLVVWADYRWAGSAREAAAKIRTRFAGKPGTVWFQGHWGFHYYMEAVGGMALDYRKVPCEVGDVLVIPFNNYAQWFPPRGTVRQTEGVTISTCSWLATMHRSPGAGFYADAQGPLPFAVGNVDPEFYWIGTVVQKGLRPVRPSRPRFPPRRERVLRSR